VYTFIKESPRKEERFVDLVSIGNLYYDPGSQIWKSENYQKEVISHIKYPCAPKHGTEVGKPAYLKEDY
jgi:hypothetical protein